MTDLALPCLVNQQQFKRLPFNSTAIQDGSVNVKIRMSKVWTHISRWRLQVDRDIQQCIPSTIRIIINLCVSLNKLRWYNTKTFKAALLPFHNQDDDLRTFLLLLRAINFNSQLLRRFLCELKKGTFEMTIVNSIEIALAVSKMLLQVIHPIYSPTLFASNSLTVYNI